VRLFKCLRRICEQETEKRSWENPRKPICKEEEEIELIRSFVLILLALINT